MSRNQNLYQQRLSKGFTQQNSSSGDAGNLYEQLLAQGFTKQEIHSVIYKRSLHGIACKNAYQKLSFTGKIQWHIQHYSRQATRFCKRLTAKGLMLLKTQFAKKPKNPI